MRLGIGHPGDKALVHNFVLSDFAKSEMGWVEAVCRAVADAAPLLVEGQDASFQNKTHLAIEAAGFGEKAATPESRLASRLPAAESVAAVRGVDGSARLRLRASAVRRFRRRRKRVHHPLGREDHDRLGALAAASRSGGTGRRAVRRGP